MTQVQATQHPHRPWWKHRAVWLIALAGVLALIAFAVFEQTSQPAVKLYSEFLDQLDAGNVASVTLQGTQIDGILKHAASTEGSKGTGDIFRTRVPDFGDPGLIPELRRQHVAINVSSSTSWTRLLAGIPLPMLLFIGAMLIAGLVRLVRGGKAKSEASAMPMHPMQGMMRLVSGLFAKETPDANPSSSTRDERQSR